MDLHVEWVGEGVPTVFLHGSMGWGRDTFPDQVRLASHGYRVGLVDRRGFGASPPTDRVDFERDAEDVCRLLTEPCHLVGQSYGAIVALLAAARCPAGVLSLAVIEPGVFTLVADDEAVRTYVARLTALFNDAPKLTPAQFRVRFAEAGGAAVTTAPELTAEDERAIRTTMSERPFWEAEVPVRELADAGFPKVVYVGGRANAAPGVKALGGRAYQLASTTLARLIGADLVEFSSSGHNPQVEQPDEFNDRLLKFWSATP